MEINENSSATDVLKIKGTADVFKKYDLYCLKCKGIVQESIQKICYNKNLDLDTFLAELNKAASDAK